jgi:hypothetical protein
MNQRPTNVAANEGTQERKTDRRELVRKLGRFAAYAAPFTVLAVSNKATAATGAHGGGPRKHP